MTFLRWLIEWFFPRLAVAFLLAIGVGCTLYFVVLPAVVQSQYEQQMPHHAFAPPDASHGAGSEDIVYFSGTYDCRDADLLIHGTAPDADYWQFGIYDAYVHALRGGHLNDRTIDTDAEGRFTLRITGDPRGRPNTLDCSDSPRGIVIYRVVLPRSEVEKPTIEVDAS